MSPRRVSACQRDRRHPATQAVPAPATQAAAQATQAAVPRAVPAMATWSAPLVPVRPAWAVRLVRLWLLVPPVRSQDSLPVAVPATRHLLACPAFLDSDLALRNST